MGAKICITIEDQATLMDILQEGRQKGLFKNLSIDTIDRLTKQITFPIQIPVEPEAIINLVGNPVVRKVCGSKVDHTVGICLQKVIETGC